MTEEVREEARDYLFEIRNDFVNEVGGILKFLQEQNKVSEKKIGFFSLLRIIFPIIEAQAGLFYGVVDNNCALTEKFLKEFFSEINPQYGKVGIYAYLGFRHGLTHTFLPHPLEVRDKIFGWQIGISDQINKYEHLRFIRGRLCIDAAQLYEDVIKGFDILLDKINNPKDDFATKTHHILRMSAVARQIEKKKTYLKYIEF